MSPHSQLTHCGSAGSIEIISDSASFAARRPIASARSSFSERLSSADSIIWLWISSISSDTITSVDVVGVVPPNHLFKLRPQTCHTMLILLFALGLRSREVRNLRFCDVDMDQSVLFINNTKFHKSRMVPFGPKVRKYLRAYMVARRKVFAPVNPEDPLFITYRRQPIGSSALGSLLRNLTNKVMPDVLPPPRIHDLRHSFAVHRLLRWYREGADVQSKLVLLSTFMGHTEINSTEVYLTITMELLKEANERFYQNCGKWIGKDIYK